MPRWFPGFVGCIKEPFPGLSHWFGMLLAIAGLCGLLVASAGRPWHVVGFSIYGATLILLYLASALAHSLHCDEKTSRQLERFDYAAIFLLIAGTHTPLCLLPLRGPVGWTLLAAVWSVAIIGVLMVSFGYARHNGVRTLLYLVMAWMCLLALPQMLTALPAGVLAWLLAGGVIYSLGAIVYVTNRPTLWNNRFVAHDLWHVMVLLGSGCHYLAVFALT